jgi:hypothetical protein
LERRCWTSLVGPPLRTSLYIILVSRPGGGKSFAISNAKSLLTAAGRYNVAPSTVTKSSLVDQIADGIKVDTESGEITHCLFVGATEFGNFLTAHDLAFLNVLNELYDCEPVFEERTRYKGKLKIDGPQLTLVGGSQPKYLAEVLPDSAWGMGFTARLIFVYEGENPKINLKLKKRSKEGLDIPDDYFIHGPARAKLVDDVKEMSLMSGEFLWEPPAAEFLEEWYGRDLEPIPQHPRLESYSSRRLIHVGKLAMIMSASESNEMIIKLPHVEAAKTTLLDAEVSMPEIFKGMTKKTQQNEIDETFDWMWMQFHTKHKPIVENTLNHFLHRMVPVDQIKRIIDQMVLSGMIKEVESGMYGSAGKLKAYEPIEKTKHGGLS